MGLQSEKGERGPQGDPGPIGPQGETGPIGPASEVPQLFDNLRARELTIVDSQGNPGIVLSLDEEFSTIELIGENGRTATVYADFQGNLVLWGSDGTFVCVWESRVDVCVIGEDGALDFPD